MITNRRRYMGNNSLPYDAEIEYLKSNGTQWINTTWKPDLTKDFHIECKVGWVRNDRGMFLSAWQGNNNLSIELFQQRKFRIYAGSSDVINTPSQPSLDELYYIETRYTANDGACVVTIGSDSYTGNVPIAGRILNTNNIVLGSDPQHRFSYSMFGTTKIYNPNLILDLIPVRVGQTGYMYDKVSGQLFGNAGTGDFILGPDKYDAEIEYLESTGTQWIDTGIKPNSTTQFLMHAKYTIPTIYDAQSGLYVSSRFHMGIFTSKFHFGIGDKFVNAKESDSNIHLFELNGSGVCKLDDETYTVSRGISEINSNIFLFARNNSNGNVSNYTNGLEIYDCQIYNDNACVVDFIPVRVGQSGYMYDRVSGRLFGNAGTGKFILGSDIIMTSESNPEVLAVCHAQGWCASPDYMTKAEAEAVTDIGTAFQSNTSITHFEELQYFTNVVTLFANAFNGCTALSSLVLPTSVTSLGSNCFVGCPFEELDLSHITSLGSQYVFNNCGIKYPWFPLLTRHGTSAGSSSAFYSCSHLSGIRLDSITFLGSFVYNYTGNVYLVVTTQSVPNSTNPARWPATIYVRDELIASYQAAANWSTKTIKGISQLPTDDPDCPWISDLREKGLIV